MKATEARMAEKEAWWNAEKHELEKACVEVYKDGFLKAMKQALFFALEIDSARFDIDRDDEQPKNELAPASWFHLLFLFIDFYFQLWMMYKFTNLPLCTFLLNSDDCITTSFYFLYNGICLFESYQVKSLGMC